MSRHPRASLTLAATSLLTLSLATAAITGTPAAQGATPDTTPTATSTATTPPATSTTAGRAAAPQVTTITIKPTSALPGERTKILAKVSGKTTKKTKVTFATQPLQGQDPTWTTIGTAQVKRGKAKTTIDAPTTTGAATYRASIGTTKKATKNAPTTVLNVGTQNVNPTYPDGLTNNTPATVTVAVGPGRNNQDLTLEQNRNGSWTTVATTTADLKSGTGRGTFTFTPKAEGATEMTLRVRAESYRGSDAATSTPTTLPITAGNGGGGGGGGAVGDTVVLTQAASDNITSISASTGQVIFGDANLAPDLNKGDVLLIRPTDAAPGGALRQVTTVPARTTSDPAPDTTDTAPRRATASYGTTNASLTDAIKNTNGPTTVDFKPIATNYKMVAAEVTAEPVTTPGDIVGNAIDLDIIRYIPDTTWETMVEGTWSTSLMPRLTLDHDTNGGTYDLSIDVWEDSQFTHDLTVNDRDPSDGGSSFDQPIGVITRLFEGNITTPDGTLPIYITVAWDLRMQITSRGADAVMGFTTTFNGDPTGTKVRTLTLNGTHTNDQGTVQAQALTRGLKGTIDMASWTGDGGAKVNNHLKVTPSLFDDTTGTADIGWLYDMTRNSGTCTITAEAAVKDIKPDTGTISALVRKIIGFLPASPTLDTIADDPTTSTKNC